MKKINFKDGYFLSNLLMATSIPGFIFLGMLVGAENFRQAMFNVVYEFMALDCMCIFAYFYLIYLMITKKQIKIKESLYILFISPIMFFSYIGHLGTSDALAVFLGEGVGSIYSLILIIAYIYALIINLKTLKNK